MHHRAPLNILSRLALLLVLPFVMAGCLTIEEHYSFKKDGSGTMEYVIDISQLGGMIESMTSSEEDAKGRKGSSKDKADGSGLGELDLSDEADRLRGMAGITKVKVDDRKKFVQRLSFRFADVDALNRALNVLMPDSTGAFTHFFAWEGNTLVRRNNKHAEMLGGDMGTDSGADEDGEEGAFDTQNMLQSMFYKYSFKFAKPIAGTTTAPGVVPDRPGSRELRMTTDWSVIMADPHALDLRIDLGD